MCVLRTWHIIEGMVFLIKLDKKSLINLKGILKNTFKPLKILKKQAFLAPYFNCAYIVNNYSNMIQND